LGQGRTPLPHFACGSAHFRILILLLHEGCLLCLASSLEFAHFLPKMLHL
jgi:hypothetical protein